MNLQVTDEERFTQAVNKLERILNTLTERVTAIEERIARYNAKGVPHKIEEWDDSLWKCVPRPYAPQLKP